MNYLIFVMLVIVGLLLMLPHFDDICNWWDRKIRKMRGKD